VGGRLEEDICCAGAVPAEQFEKVLRFTVQNECRMGALVKHFGDVGMRAAHAGVRCVRSGRAVLRLFRRATAEEVDSTGIVDDLRP